MWFAVASAAFVGVASLFVGGSETVRAWRGMGEHCGCKAKDCAMPCTGCCGTEACDKAPIPPDPAAARR